jgi:hypothetical protein
MLTLPEILESSKELRLKALFNVGMTVNSA